MLWFLFFFPAQRQTDVSSSGFFFSQVLFGGVLRSVRCLGFVVLHTSTTTVGFPPLFLPPRTHTDRGSPPLSSVVCVWRSIFSSLGAHESGTHTCTKKRHHFPFLLPFVSLALASFTANTHRRPLLQISQFTNTFFLPVFSLKHLVEAFPCS
jgi:hypothetical protein